MARRRIVEDSVSHDRWLVSYADFITLLFAFFVVMYSISQVNEGKYKVLSETLTEVFTRQEPGTPEHTLDPFQVGEIAKSNPQSFIELEATKILEKDGSSEGSREGEQLEQGGLPEEFQQINQKIDESLAELLKSNLVTVRGNEKWLEVELKSSLLFGSGDSTLSLPALELLGSIASILKDQTNPIRVEGFTDNRPINSARYPSNWELSAGRASAVVKFFIEEGLAADRLAAIGYGEHQPITDNNSEESRAANRRVVLMISKTGELRPELREITSSEELLAGRVEPLDEGNTGIEIIIPGVNSESAEIPASENETVTSDQQTGNGVRTIELEGGGLLFTNDAPREGDE
ncbi:MAG: flagellar motor protein MotD [Oceanicoccus sp.]